MFIYLESTEGLALSDIEEAKAIIRQGVTHANAAHADGLSKRLIGLDASGSATEEVADKLYDLVASYEEDVMGRFQALVRAHDRHALKVAVFWKLGVHSIVIAFFQEKYGIEWHSGDFETALEEHEPLECLQAIYPEARTPQRVFWTFCVEAIVSHNHMDVAQIVADAIKNPRVFGEVPKDIDPTGMLQKVVLNLARSSRE